MDSGVAARPPGLQWSEKAARATGAETKPSSAGLVGQATVRPQASAEPSTVPQHASFAGLRQGDNSGPGSRSPAFTLDDGHSGAGVETPTLEPVLSGDPLSEKDGRALLGTLPNARSESLPDVSAFADGAMQHTSGEGDARGLTRVDGAHVVADDLGAAHPIARNPEVAKDAASLGRSAAAAPHQPPTCSAGSPTTQPARAAAGEIAMASARPTLHASQSRQLQFGNTHHSDPTNLAENIEYFADDAPDRPHRQGHGLQGIDAFQISGFAKAASPKAVLSEAGAVDPNGISRDADSASANATVPGARSQPLHVEGARLSPASFLLPEQSAASIGRSLAAQLGGEASSGQIELRLDPPELGRIEMTFEGSEDRLRAVISAERAGTADVLRRHSDLLVLQLRNAGFECVDLSFGEFTNGQDRDDGRREFVIGPDESGTMTDSLPDALRISSRDPIRPTSPGSSLDLKV